MSTGARTAQMTPRHSRGADFALACDAGERSAFGLRSRPSLPNPEATALNPLDLYSVSQLRQFFDLLARWDQEAHER